MRNPIKLYLGLFILICVSVISCKSNNNPEFDSVLRVSLTYILKNNRLAKEYYEQPLRVVRSRKLPIKDPLIVNGKTCVLLPENANVNNILRGMDVFEPIPVVEVIDFHSYDKLIRLKLIFRTTGHFFNVTMRENKGRNFEVVKVEDSRI